MQIEVTMRYPDGDDDDDGEDEEEESEEDEEANRQDAVKDIEVEMIVQLCKEPGFRIRKPRIFLRHQIA